MMANVKKKKQVNQKTSKEKNAAGKKKQTAEKKPTEKNTAKKTIKKSGKASASGKKGAKKSRKNKDVSSGERRYVLDSVLVINNSNTIHGQLNALINAKKDIVIDASSVEMTDTSVLQLLLAFVKKLHAEGLKVTWVSPSRELLNRAEILGITEQLDLGDR
jgi:anti-anti-sigma regulatory factor